MNRVIPYLLVGLVVLGFVALAWLLNAIQDRLYAGIAALILYILRNEWKIGNLEERVESLETQLAASAAPAASAPTLAELGDLRNPTPEQLARGLGQDPKE
jgi:hypothetical protein